MKKITRHHKKLNFTYIITGIIACFIILFAFPWVGSVISDNSGYYVLVLDGEEIGAAPNKEIIEEAVLNARLKLNEEADSIVYVEPKIEILEENRIFGSMDLEENIEEIVYNTLKDNSGLTKTQAYVVSIDGFTVTLENKEDIVSLLEAAKADYDEENDFQVELSETSEGVFSAVTYDITKVEIEENDVVAVMSSETDVLDASEVEEVDPTSGENDGVFSLAFAEQIEILETCVDVGSILTLDEAIDAVTKDTESNKIYVVESGDNLSYIASKFDLSLEKLLSMNDGIKASSTIGVGDQLTVTVPEPELSVIVEEEVTYEESYKADVIYIEDDSMYKGEQVVVDSGKKGYRKVTAIVTYRNGVETDREIIAQSLISESEPKIIKTGTLVPPTYVWPVYGGSISSYFGYRWGRLHEGIDIYKPSGSAVFASCGGVVDSAGWMGGYGYCVVLRHPDGKKTRYAHLSSISVSTGQSVDQYQNIGLVGSTGRSTGPHLHFEVIVNGVPQNPLSYLSY